MLTPIEIAVNWLKEGRSCALATVIETWGSAPRPVGSHLIIDSDGNFEGSVSGGCVEGTVIAESLDLIEAKGENLLNFGVADESAWEVGLSCGGKIAVYVEYINEAKASELLAINQKLVRREAASRSISAIGFTQNYAPPLKLVITGAVHISQMLAPLAKSVNLEAIIIDPRTAFATKERFPDVAIHADWAQNVLEKYPLDKFTAFAALTHDPKIDDPALEAALKAECFYIGALGSRKTHAKRLDRFKDKFTAEQLSVIKAPIGLDIGAISPQEISIAVIAEVIKAKP